MVLEFPEGEDCAEEKVVLVVKDVEYELLDLETDDEGGKIKGEMRIGIGVPLAIEFEFVGVGSKGKVITLPDNCRSLIINWVGEVVSWKFPVGLEEVLCKCACAGPYQYWRLSATTPGSTPKTGRRAEIFAMI